MPYPKIFSRTFHILNKPMVKIDTPLMIYLDIIEIISIMPFIVPIIIIHELIKKSMRQKYYFISFLFMILQTSIINSFILYIGHNLKHGYFKKRDICDNLLIEKII